MKRTITPDAGRVEYRTGQEVFFADYEHGTVMSGILLDATGNGASVALRSGAVRNVERTGISPDWETALSRY